MFNKKLLVALFAIAIIGMTALVLGCTSPTPTPTPVPTSNPTITPVPLSGTVSISGSTTIQPVSELLAKAFQNNNSGVVVNVAGGGSGKGESDIGAGLVDIGAASENVPASTMAKYPNIQTWKIGASAVVVIVNAQDSVSSISKSDLAALFDNVTGNKPAAWSAFTVYTRAESSGTADTFSGYVLGNKTYIYNSVETTGATGNPGVVNGVASAKNSIGFADYGFAIANPNVKIIGIVDGNMTYPAPTRDNLLKVLKGTDTTLYPVALTRPLNYLTNGAPTPLVKAFIDFALAPQNEYAFQQNGFFSVNDLA